MPIYKAIILAALIVILPLNAYAFNIKAGENDVALANGVVLSDLIINEQEAPSGNVVLFTLTFPGGFSFYDMQKFAVSYLSTFNKGHLIYVHLINNDNGLVNDCGYLEPAGGGYSHTSSMPEMWNVVLGMYNYSYLHGGITRESPSPTVYYEKEKNNEDEVSTKPLHKSRKRNHSTSITREENKCIFLKNGSMIKCEDAWVCGKEMDSVCYLKNGKGLNISINKVDKEKTFPSENK